MASPNNFIPQMSITRRTECSLPPLRQKIDQYSYTAKESIGKGYSSSVYRGRDDRTDQSVAIKVIDMKNMKGEIYKTLLAAEIEILNLIKNKPNLLDVHKICEDKNKTYIITDYCQGGDLSRYIKSHKKLPEQEAVRILKEIIRGYESLYHLGIVHRDLKPANIFFHNSHSEIGDFGFAIREQKLKTSERYNVGSPVYMPPQALNSNRYSFKSDIWAIGIIFYEMLTGSTPWTGRTETELKAKMKTISIQNILPPSLAPASRAFLLRALDSNIKSRMEPAEMFEHFYIEHEAMDSTQPQRRNLFRSMRKPISRETNTSSSKPSSMKRTTDNSGWKSVQKSGFTQTTTQNHLQLPRTAAEPKHEKEYLSAIHKRNISKQLLNQVHFCRFLFKIVLNMEACTGCEFQARTAQSLNTLLFYKLNEVRTLKLLPGEAVEEYRNFGDFKKLLNLVEEYEVKYLRKLSMEARPALPDFYTKEQYAALREGLKGQIRELYTWIFENCRQPNFLIREIVVMDYMVTLFQLLDILSLQSLAEFSNRSKIQAIVDGEPLEDVNSEHLRMIRNKMQALKIMQ